MKRKGLINWKNKLSAEPPAVQITTSNQLQSSIDLPYPSQSPTRARVSTQRLTGGKQIVEFRATLSIHVQETNVLLTSGLSSNNGQDIFLGDNEHFKEGDIVEVTPVGTEAENNRATSARGVIEKAAQAALNKQSMHENGRDAAWGQSVDAPRPSLVVTLENFYRPEKTQKKLYVSIEQTLAELHGLRKDMQIYVRKIPNAELRAFANSTRTQQQGGKPKSYNRSRRGSSTPSSVVSSQHFKSLVADRLEITVRDQLVSRRDMWQLVQQLNERTVFKGDYVDLQSVKFKIRNIFTSHQVTSRQEERKSSPPPAPHERNEKHVEQNSAIVSTSFTKVTFYSKSCQVYCLIEVSKELYSFDSEGFLQMEKCLLFVRSYLERCKADYSTHEIVFILYARVYYPQARTKEELVKYAKEYTKRNDLTMDELLKKEGVYQFSRDRIFQDIYLKAGVVNLTLENTKTDNDKLLAALRSYLQKFPQMVNWQTKCPINVRSEDWKETEDKDKDCFRLPCELGDSERTNILEAINLALFNLNNEEVDQNLRTTGTQMLLLTAGQATYRVNSAIISPTKSRLLLGGVQVQMISFAREPPYKTPLLIRCCQYANPFEKSSPGVVLRSQSRVNLLKQSFTEEQVQMSEQLEQAAKYSQHKQSKDTSYYWLEWMQVTFLPHVKLLDTHLQMQQRKASALLSLSKTPLIAPRFSQFQQARLMADVFGGLTKRDERLFEPHSMFRTQTLQLNSYQQSGTARGHDPSFQSSGHHNDEKRDKKGSKRRHKYWRMDPDMYKLRKPENGNECFLLDAENNNNAVLDQALGGGGGLRSIIENAQGDDSITMHESTCTFVGGSDQEDRSLEVSTDRLNSPTLFQNYRKNVTPKTRNLRAKLDLKKKLNLYDASVGGGAPQTTMNFDSPITSYASSPQKRTGRHYHHLYNSSNSPEPAPPMLTAHLKSELSGASINSQHNQSVVLREQEKKYLQSILEKKPENGAMERGLVKNVDIFRLPLPHIANSNLVAQSSQFQAGTFDQSQSIQMSVSAFEGDKKNAMALSTKKSIPLPKHVITQQQQQHSRGDTTASKTTRQQQQQQNMMQEETADRHLRSYARRWGHAVGVFRFSIFQRQQTNFSKNPYSLSYDQVEESGGFNRSSNAYDLAITKNHFEPLCRVMDQFWKQLSDVAQMPLTTAYFPAELANYEEKQTSHGQQREGKQKQERSDDQNAKKEKYKQERSGDPNAKKEDSKENLCLRLTQNFQFFNERGCCDFQPSEDSSYKYKMAFRDIYFECEATATRGINSKLWFKYNDEQKDSHLQTVAQFHYLLYNHHTRRFQAKTSQENRLFDIKKLKNLNYVQNNMVEADQNCVKLPQIGYVIFYDRQEARRQRQTDDQQEAQKQKLQTLLNGIDQTDSAKVATLIEEFEDVEEERDFKELLRRGLVDILKGGQGRTTLFQDIRIHKRKDIKAQDLRLAREIGPDLSPYDSRHNNFQYSQSLISNSAKKPQLNNPLNSPVATDDENASFDAHAKPKYQTQQVTPTKQDKDYDLPETIIERPDSQGCSLSNMSQQSDIFNKTMADYNMHSSLSPHMSMTYMNHLAQSNHTMMMVPHGQSRRVSSDMQKLSTKRHVIKLASNTGADDHGDTSDILFEHDIQYTTGACFHIKFKWILAKGPELHERVIKRLNRKVSEVSNGRFKILPLSEIMQSLQLNPFELETALRRDYRSRITDKFTQRRAKQLVEMNRKSVINADEFSLQMEEVDEDDIVPSERHFNRRSRVQQSTFVIQTESIEKQERLFQAIFPRLLVEECGYVLERKIRVKDEPGQQKSAYHTLSYYLERESGFSSVKHNVCTNAVTYVENDIINNGNIDYQASIKSRKKVEATITSLDIILDLLFDQNTLPQ